MAIAARGLNAIGQAGRRDHPEQKRRVCGEGLLERVGEGDALVSSDVLREGTVRVVGVAEDDGRGRDISGTDCRRTFYGGCGQQRQNRGGRESNHRRMVSTVQFPPQNAFIPL